ncbi:MAG: 1-acyl-sn-glycerol-3-phosphate acyltransferase [Synechococcales cyanobacterium RM1_1_8]|nr:1-acyl-sn-glycerol-3-phosphate acyltransferase [Synechococcales cyanobacterium RM1_1_8]
MTSPAALSPYKLREPGVSLALYRGLKWAVVAPLFYGYFSGRIHGQNQVPRQGPFIAVGNHASDFDPPFLSISMGRPVAFMAKADLFEVPLLGPGIRLYGAYPVRRGESDRKALRSAMAFLERGWGAGLFIGGTRTADGRIPEPKIGAAWIAAKMQVPLLPVSLWGTEQIKGAVKPRQVPVTIRIGELIEPPASTQRPLLEATTEQCVAAIHQLHDLGR